MIKKIRNIFTKNEPKKEEVKNEDLLEITDQKTLLYSKGLELSVMEKKELVKTLTPREKDTYLLLVEGYTLKEIAEQLSVSYSTANTHQANIYRKLGVNTKAEIIINFRNIK